MTWAGDTAQTQSGIDLEGFIGYWDCGESSWTEDPVLMLERCNWCIAVVGEAVRTYRIEFFIVDAPFAVVFRYSRDPCTGKMYRDPITREVAKDPPVICLLDSLPPEYCR